MKTITRHICLLIVAALLAFVCNAIPASAADLTIRVEGLRSSDGVVRFGLYNDAKEFPKGERYRRGFVAAADHAAEIQFTGLAAGVYAVAIYHDENNDNTFDQGLFGIPLEDFGFSNDATVFFSPPDFDEAAFDVLEPHTKIVIDLGNDAADRSRTETAVENEAWVSGL